MRGSARSAATRLEAACPSCGTANQLGAKFCKKCGQRLSGPEAEPRCRARDSVHLRRYTPKHLAEKILTSKAALEGERKQVTVLFADLKGSMELLADRDPEEARKLLDPVLERMMEAVHRYEGTVNQVMGDGIMALFGAPLAHEDHAVRACYAALGCRRRCGATRRRSGARTGVDVQIRVGLNSGEVVVRAIGSDLRMDYSAVGPDHAPGGPHGAARRARAAPCSPPTRCAGRGLRRGQAARPGAGQGAGGASRGLRAGRGRAARGRGSRRRRPRPDPLRRAGTRELEQLRAGARRARQGHGQVVAVVGEPGVGKSRLVWEFTHSHRDHGWLCWRPLGLVREGHAVPARDRAAQGVLPDRGPRRPAAIREKVTGQDPDPRPRRWSPPCPPSSRSWTCRSRSRVGGPRSAPAAPADARRGQAPAAAREPGPAAAPGLRGSPLDRRRDPGAARQPRREPPDRAAPAPRQLPPGVPARLGRARPTTRQLRLDPLPPESAEELLEGLLGQDAGPASRSSGS